MVIILPVSGFAQSLTGSWRGQGKKGRKLPEPNIYPHLSTPVYAEISENDLTITQLAFF